jgi:hypothetical protein
VLAPKPRPWILRDWQLELGMGAPFGGPTTDPASGRGIGSQLAVRKGLTSWGLNVGLLEVSAATVEGAPTPGEPGNRSDIFLRQRAVTLGWNWRLNGGKAGLLGLRAGTALWGGNARIETVYHQPENGQTGEQLVDSDFEAPRGGWLAGVQYFAPMESHLSIGVDATYHDVRLGEPVPGLLTHHFVTVLLAVQIRP